MIRVVELLADNMTIRMDYGLESRFLNSICL